MRQDAMLSSVQKYADLLCLFLPVRDYMDRLLEAPLVFEDITAVQSCETAVGRLVVLALLRCDGPRRVPFAPDVASAHRKQELGL